MKKAILIGAGYDFPHHRSSLAVAPPLGLLAVGSYLAAHEVPVELIDVQMDFGFGLTREAEHIISQRVAQYLRDQADAIAWIGISQTSTAETGLTLAQEIHTALPETPLIFGGYFPSGNYQLLLRKYPFITAVVRGDGEAAALQISRDLAEGRSFLSPRTPNLAWLNGEEIRTSPIQPMPLDNLPIFDFRLLRNKSCYSFIAIVTSRGCPFSCNYCLEGGMRPYAAYPLEWVAEQLDHLETELLNGRVSMHVSIGDPIFGVGRRRTLELCQIMRDYPFTYTLESRVDLLTPDLIPLLRQAGVQTIYWGIESASPTTLVRMEKVNSETQAKGYLKNALEVLKACFENGVIAYLGFMLAFPGDSEADLQASLEFHKDVRRLHNQIAVDTGVKPGFIPAPDITSIHAGSPLAEQMAESFPEVVLSAQSFEGEATVVSPSPGVGPDMLRRYEEKIKEQGEYTPQVSELMKHYIFSAQDFIASHSELTDDQGVTKFC